MKINYKNCPLFFHFGQSFDVDNMNVRLLSDLYAFFGIFGDTIFLATVPLLNLTKALQSTPFHNPPEHNIGYC